MALSSTIEVVGPQQWAFTYGDGHPVPPDAAPTVGQELIVTGTGLALSVGDRLLIAPVATPAGRRALPASCPFIRSMSVYVNNVTVDATGLSHFMTNFSIPTTGTSMTLLRIAFVSSFILGNGLRRYWTTMVQSSVKRHLSAGGALPTAPARAPAFALVHVPSMPTPAHFCWPNAIPHLAPVRSRPHAAWLGRVG